MAQAKKISKSDEVRKELAAGVTSPKEVVAKLAKRKINVSAALVSQIKARELYGESHGSAGGSAAHSHEISPEDVMAVLNLRKLVSQYGAEHVKSVVDEVASLMA